MWQNVLQTVVNRTLHSANPPGISNSCILICLFGHKTVTCLVAKLVNRIHEFEIPGGHLPGGFALCSVLFTTVCKTFLVVFALCIASILKKAFWPNNLQTPFLNPRDLCVVYGSLVVQFRRSLRKSCPKCHLGHHFRHHFRDHRRSDRNCTTKLP